MSSVALIGIAKSFGRQPALEALNLEVADGEFMVVVGPSGCGKSTLLRIIAGLEQPDCGDVVIGAQRVTHWPPARRGVGPSRAMELVPPHHETGRR